MERLGRYALFLGEMAVAIGIAFLLGFEFGSIAWWAVVIVVFIGLGVLQFVWLVLRRES